MYIYTATATDSGNPAQQVTGTYSISVASPVTILGNVGASTSGVLPAATTGVPYSSAPLAMGGIAPYALSWFSSNWCGCLTIDSKTGMISGVPTMPGNYTLSLNATDSQGRFASANLTLTISAGPLSLTTANMPGGQVGWIYDQIVPIAGGVMPYAVQLTGGSVPPGMSLDGTGDLRGIPTTSGTYGFTVLITDSKGQTLNGSLSITVQ